MQHDHGGAVVAVRQFAQELHELARIIHVQIVERLVQQHVFGGLAEHHGNQGALALPAGKFGEVAVGDGFELELDDGLLHNGFIFVFGAALVVGVAAEHEQVAHGNAAVDAVFLGEDGEDFGGFGGGGGGQVTAVVGDAAGLGGLQPRH